MNHKVDPEWAKLMANFFINVIMPSWNEKKEPFPLPIWCVRDIVKQVYEKKATFSQAKQRYKDSIELLKFIEDKTPYCFSRNATHAPDSKNYYLPGFEKYFGIKK